MYKTLDDLPKRIRDAVREAMPGGVGEFDLFITSPWPALGNRSVVEALEQDGYAAESLVINACAALKRLRHQNASRGVL